MTKHSELKVVPFKPEQLFEMVADVKSYPKFLPWCVGARIRSVENELIVDGEVNVVSVDIIAPLQKDSWTQQTIEEWDHLKDLDGANFLGAWLDCLLYTSPSPRD